jgi:hypothetical protein
MRVRSVALAAILLGSGMLLAGASTATGQQPGAEPKKVFGYMDPKTGTFVAATPMAHPDASTTPATTGTITLTITMKLVTAFPAKSTIGCALNLQALSLTVNPTTFASAEAIWEESAASSATISGSTATCKVSIPYAWVLPAASASTGTTNTLSAGFVVTASNAASTPSVLRVSTQSLIEGEAVPATGSVSSYTANVTL